MKAPLTVDSSLLTTAEFIRQMPKVELHVHLEGSVRPETLLELAKRHSITLPADTVEGLRQWYQFTSFDHFVEIYRLISRCIQTLDDLTLITRQFLMGQAEQNILYSEVTFTPYTHFTQKNLSFEAQLLAIDAARDWGQKQLGVTMSLIPDIDRSGTPESGLIVADWAISGMNRGVVALGLGGAETDNPPEKFIAAFQRAADAGLPAVPHAGETAGAVSIWGALNALNAVRIGHGVRCLEDTALVDVLRQKQIPLEVCPTSNVCLGVASNWTEHPLPKLIAHGLNVTLNSDDPPMFNTTLTQEYQQAVQTFQWDRAMLKTCVTNAVRAALLPEPAKTNLTAQVETGFATFDPVPDQRLPWHIYRLSKILYLIVWQSTPTPELGEQFIDHLQTLLNRSPHPIVFLSDLRRGMITEPLVINKLARLTAHKNWDQGTAFGTARGLVYARIFSGLARRFKPGEDAWATLHDAIQYLEHLRPDITQNVDWAAVKTTINA
jgi:adenosine deaminase